jgi:hypothetical protein
VSLAIRHACVHDAPALARLAALDSSSRLGGDVLLAEVDGTPLAALSLRDGAVVADPFEPTAELVELLRLRAAQARASAAPGRTRRWRLRAAAQTAGT